MIQVDGLPFKEFQRALDQNRMPFLKELLAGENHHLYPIYSGLPASTPAVQAELHYNIPHAVPAFEFFHRERGRIFRMYDSESARFIQEELGNKGTSILEQGTSLANIYQGAPDESAFCAARLGADTLLKKSSGWASFLYLVANGGALIRAGLLSAIELVLAVYDTLSGAIQGQHLAQERGRH